MPAAPPSPSREDLARELLRYKMMEYSDDFFCATWLLDLEFELWRAADIDHPSRTQEYVVSLGKELRILAGIAGGWWVYEDETCPLDSGPVFICMERWKQILSSRSSSP